MSNLLDLAIRCEKAIGPDRELDIEILRATDANGYRIEADGTILVSGDMGDGPGWFNIGYDVPAFTASIDAAMTLGELGAEISISTLYGIARVEYPLNFADHEPYRGEHVGGLIAPATCAAILRAIEGKLNAPITTSTIPMVDEIGDGMHDETVTKERDSHRH